MQEHANGLEWSTKRCWNQWAFTWSCLNTFQIPQVCGLSPTTLFKRKKYFSVASPLKMKVLSFEILGTTGLKPNHIPENLMAPWGGIHKGILLEVFFLGNIECEARERGLLINENKTKYMEITRTVVNGNHLQCGKYEFKRVKELSYLGSQLNQTNSANCEIQARIISGNRCYYSCGTLMKSRALNRSLKLKIYKTLIRPAVT